MPSSVDDKLAFPNSDYAEEGMTLRDYFAAKAMQAFMSDSDTSWGSENYKFAARAAYRLADAMMEEREE